MSEPQSESSSPTSVEFVTFGVPVSLQGSSRGRNEWRERVCVAARERIAEEQRLEFVDLRATIVWFHMDEDVADIDNIAKVILDGASGIAFGDDRQIAQVLIRRTPLAGGAILRAPPPLVAAALELSQDFVYVHFSTDPIDHGRLP